MSLTEWLKAVVASVRVVSRVVGGELIFILLSIFGLNGLECNKSY